MIPPGQVPAATGDLSRVGQALEADAPLDEELEDGRLVLTGGHPFLVVLRSDADDPLTRLVLSEASYLLADPSAEAGSLQRLVRTVAEAGARRHGAFLIIELWQGDDDFRLLAPEGPAPATVEALEQGLEELDTGGRPATVRVEATAERHPPGLPPLLTISECHELGCLLLGLEVPDVYRDPETGDVFPIFLRRLAHGFSDVLRRAVFEFLRVQTGADLPSSRALGRSTLDEAVWEADRRLAEIDTSFDLLLLTSPVDADRAWERFRDGGYEVHPEFHYRLLPVDPDLLKRRLYDVRLEDIHDAAAWTLLHDKREELDRQISLLSDRGRPSFIHGSIRLFGGVDPALLDRAHEILAEVPLPRRIPARQRVDAEEFAARARQEFDHYRSRYDGFSSEIQVRPDLVGLMVSSGRLLVGRHLALRPERVEALIQHEVGTHVLTYVNGAAQPFLQLAHGFADYDELQEGLGVLAEYMVGGLDAGRMRLLAARVVAVQDLIDGAEFIEAFRRLTRDHGFGPRSAFDIITRVHQSGGFTRDVIYLRGLVSVIRHLREGGALEPLYVGKIAARHLDVVRELEERGVLAPMPLLPRFLEWPDAQERLGALRDGLPIHAMISEPATT